jgi:membrane protein required for colicin V production
MTIVDIVIIVAALASVVIGFLRGFVREAISIAALLVAIWAAMHLGPYAGGWLGGTIESTEAQLWAGRGIIFIFVLAFGALLGWAVSKIIGMSGLKGIDRALGCLFGMLRAALILGLFALAGRYAGLSEEDWWLNSRIMPYGEIIADWINVMGPRGVEMLQHEYLQDDLALKIPLLIND